jgi:polysaccharide export outer membrane protein
VTTQPGGADGTGKPALGGERRPLYRLAKSDIVEIDFTFSPEFNQTVSVQPDGYLRLKNLGEVYAEGKTLNELEESVHAVCQGTLHDPELTVLLREFDKPWFMALGEVGRPGKYELRGETSLTQAIALAGGFTHSARHSQVVLFRRRPDGQVDARVMDVKKMLSARDLGEEPVLIPGDWLYVPQNTISKVKPYLPVPTVGAYVSPAQF